MGAIETLRRELYQVRREAFKSGREDHKFAIYFGRTAEMHFKSDPEVLQLLRFSVDLKQKMLEHQTFMDAMIHLDYGLPDEAVCIHVNGKPYTTFTFSAAA